MEPQVPALGSQEDQPPLSGFDSTYSAGESGKGDTTDDGQPEMPPLISEGEGSSPGKGDVAQKEPPTPKPATETEQPQPKKAAVAELETPPEPVMAKEPTRARIVVSVTVKGALRSGLLQTDRIDREPGYCWVRLDNDGKDTLRVRVSDVQLLGVEGED